MQRRKFLLGAGSLAAAGAAAMGTGAFSAVRVDRDLTVGIAADNSAYLGLVPEGPYAAIDGNQITLDFAGGGGPGLNQDGDGLNENSDTEFGDVFRIDNNGTSTVRVQPSDTPTGISWNNQALSLFHSATEDVNAGTGWNTFNNIGTQNHYDPTGGGRPAAFLDLGPGDSAYIHVGIYLNGANTVSDVPNQIGIYADDSV